MAGFRAPVKTGFAGHARFYPPQFPHAPNSGTRPS